MLLHRVIPRHHERPERLPGLRAAFRDARETYRRSSGTAASVDIAPAPAAAATAPVVAAPSPLGDPDVVVDIPHVHVDEISLELDELKARVALDASVLDLLRLNVGVDAELRGVRLDIKGVDAQALLKARLDNLTLILDRVMGTIDANPQILERLTEHLGATVEEVGRGTGHAVGDLGGGLGAVGHALAPQPEPQPEDGDARPAG